MDDLKETTNSECPMPSELLPEPAEASELPEDFFPGNSSASETPSALVTPSAHETSSTHEAPSTPEALSTTDTPSTPETPPTPDEPSEASSSTAEPPVFAKLGFFRSVIAAILVSSLAFFTVLVEHVRRSKQFGFSTASEYVTTGLQVVIYVVLFVIGWKLLDRFDRQAVLADAPASSNRKSKVTSEDPGNDNAKANVTHGPSPRLLFSWSPRSVILTWILLLALFVPYLLAFYPGVASMDTTNQIKDFTTGTMPIEINWNEG